MLTRPIRWELVAQNYDQLIRYATALRLGTAEAEQVLRRLGQRDGLGAVGGFGAPLEVDGEPAAPAAER